MSDERYARLRRAVTDVLDSEIGDDAVVLRRMLRDALNEPEGAADKEGPSNGVSPPGLSVDTSGSLSADAATVRDALWDARVMEEDGGGSVAGWDAALVAHDRLCDALNEPSALEDSSSAGSGPIRKDGPGGGSLSAFTADTTIIRNALLTVGRAFVSGGALAALARVEAAHTAADDLLRRLSEWDVLNLPSGGHDDGPYWQREIARARGVLAVSPRDTPPDICPDCFGKGLTGQDAGPGIVAPADDCPRCRGTGRLAAGSSRDTTGGTENG